MSRDADYGEPELRIDPRQAGFPGPAQGVTAMKSGGITGSQLGFSGTEDLGGGNQAVFMLEVLNVTKKSS
jgi:predicted porin